MKELLEKAKDIVWLKQAFLYGIVGVIATVVDWGMFFLANSVFSVHYQVSVVAAIIAGGTVNYLLNKSITFRNKSERVGLQLGAYIAVFLTSVAMTSGWMYLFVEIVELKPIVGRIVTTFVMYGINFVMCKFLVYNEKLIR